MVRKFIAAAAIWLIASSAMAQSGPQYDPMRAHDQTFARLIGRDTGTLTICVIGTTSTCQIPLTVSGGSGTSSSFAATFPSTGTALGVKNGANMVNLTADGSSNLNVNCAVGCSGGTASNASSAVATSSTNGTANSWLYGFNGTTWDQLQVDASKQLKVVAAQATAANLNATVVGTGTFAVQASDASAGAAAATTSTVGSLSQGLVSTSAPTYTTGQRDPISLTTTGAQRVITLDTNGTPIDFTKPSGVYMQNTGTTGTVATTPSSSFAFDQSTAGTYQVIALSASKIPSLLGFALVGSAAQTIKVVSGTGTNCATGTTARTGVMSFAANGGINYTPPIYGAAGEAICFVISASVQTGGGGAYAVQ